ncbi:NAD(P)/FAD-dependent oxidoreductase [Flagellimonas flava]|uniref:Dehydrogenase (Flavoprotein) n=1 Tax=Flagellimonas flava TaxID=570519 RepID=A0A1M5IL96_9FLAO|nr:NAD(P)/FAD-dependent oxidoreductase [Allomuricauda flava]SHG29092.1 Dehydrogenase (flavoprotein) [Allomuricauda flava]
MAGIFVSIPYLHGVKDSEVLVVGGGLAGLTAALDLAGKGKQVTVVEKKEYPRHKVCGEYVSNEVRPYLDYLGVDLDSMRLPEINRFQLSTKNGKLVEVKLPLGGFGISRYTFDNLLYQTAKAKGVHFLFGTVTNIQCNANDFVVELASKAKLKAKVVLGAYGKRSKLDVAMGRRDLEQKSPWVGIKCHYKGYNHPENVVALHNFPGGYAGISKVENEIVNLCYLVQEEQFRKISNIERFNREVLGQNRFLKDFIARARPVFGKPMSIAQISFDVKSQVENHIVMCGDTAGMIHPLCGNGMAMAIHSAKIASAEVERFLNGVHKTRKSMELGYQKQWRKEFGKRLWMGRRLQALMMHTKWFNLGMDTVARSKLVLESLIKNTHGSPIIN